MSKNNFSVGKYYSDEKWDKVNPENKYIMEEFIASKINLSPNSEYQYTQAVKIFFIWVMENAGNKPLYKLRSIDISRYQRWMLDNELNAGTVRFRISVLSSMCKILKNINRDVEEWKNFQNIVVDVDRAKGAKKHEKQPLTMEEMDLLRKHLKEKEEWQKLAYLELSYSTGARIGAIMSLRREIAEAIPNKVNGKTFYFTHEVREKGEGRAGEVRKLSFSEEAMQSVKKWLEHRKEIYGEDDCEYLFVTKNKVDGVKQLSKNTFNYWCSKHFTEVIGRRVHPHLFRSTRATHLVVEEGKDIASAQALLGHKSSSTTEIYVVKDNTKDIADCF